MGVVIESLGWFGAVTILGGYLLFSAGKLRNGVTYQVVNLVGALAITVNVLAHHAWPSTIVNGIWAVIAAVVLVRMWIDRARAGRQADHHAEPPTTTLVLPVMGPPVRHPAPADERPAPADERRTPADEQPAPADHPVAATRPTGPAPSLQTGSLTMADVPVVTAAIALAIITAARDEAAHSADVADHAEHAER